MSDSDPRPFPRTSDERQNQVAFTQLAEEKHLGNSPFATNNPSVRSSLTTLGVEIMALREHHCRWPLVRAADERQLYCGTHRTGNSSYCATHAKISYAPSQNRQRNVAAKAVYA